MKFTALILMFFWLLAPSSYGQTTKKAHSVFQDITVKETITVDLDGKDYDITALESLKDDLLMYEEKILKVYLEPSSKLMKITYNGFMQRYDFENAFSKNGISFYRKEAISVDAVKDEEN